MHRIPRARSSSRAANAGDRDGIFRVAGKVARRIGVRKEQKGRVDVIKERKE